MPLFSFCYGHPLLTPAHARAPLQFADKSFTVYGAGASFTDPEHTASLARAFSPHNTPPNPGRLAASSAGSLRDVDARQDARAPSDTGSHKHHAGAGGHPPILAGASDKHHSVSGRSISFCGPTGRPLPQLLAEPAPGEPAPAIVAVE